MIKLKGKNPSQLDVEIGLKIKEARENAGISQMTLSEKLGISFQQLQKYEYGKNRISASRLYILAYTLQVDINDLLPNNPL